MGLDNKFMGLDKWYNFIEDNRGLYSDMEDAVNYVADLVEPSRYGEWSLENFDIVDAGEMTLEQISEWDDFSSWVELDNDKDLSDEEKQDELFSFRGTIWAKRAQEWKRKGIPPIILVEFPDEEGRIRTAVGDGRGRINFAYLFHIPKLHVIKLIYRG